MKKFIRKALTMLLIVSLISVHGQFVHATVEDVPETPRGIQASSTETTVTILWQAVSENVYYEVLFDNRTQTTSNISLTVFDLEPDTFYTFKVRTVSQGVTSPYSNATTISTDSEVPGIPSGVSASVVNGNMTVSWAPVEGARLYEVKINGSVNSTSGTSYTYTDVQVGKVYTYSVRAKNSAGSSPYSSNQDTLIEETIEPVKETETRAEPESISETEASTEESTLPVTEPRTQTQPTTEPAAQPDTETGTAPPSATDEPLPEATTAVDEGQASEVPVDADDTGMVDVEFEAVPDPEDVEGLDEAEGLELLGTRVFKKGSQLNLKWSLDNSESPDAYVLKIHNSRGLEVFDSGVMAADDPLYKPVIPSNTDGELLPRELPHKYFHFEVPAYVFEDYAYYLIDIFVVRDNEFVSSRSWMFEAVGNKSGKVVTLGYQRSEYKRYFLNGKTKEIDPGNVDSIGFFYGVSSAVTMEVAGAYVGESVDFAADVEWTADTGNMYYKSYVKMKDGRVITGDLRLIEATDLPIETKPQIIDYETTFVNEENDLMTMSVLTDMSAETIVIYDSYGSAISYMDAYVIEGDHKSWHIERAYRRTGIYVEDIYVYDKAGVSTNIRSRVLAEGLAYQPLFIDATDEFYRYFLGDKQKVRLRGKVVTSAPNDLIREVYLTYSNTDGEQMVISNGYYEDRSTYLNKNDLSLEAGTYPFNRLGMYSIGIHGLSDAYLQCLDPLERVLVSIESPILAVGLPETMIVPEGTETYQINGNVSMQDGSNIIKVVVVNGDKQHEIYDKVPFFGGAVTSVELTDLLDLDFDVNGVAGIKVYVETADGRGFVHNMNFYEGRLSIQLPKSIDINGFGDIRVELSHGPIKRLVTEKVTITTEDESIGQVKGTVFYPEAAGNTVIKAVYIGEQASLTTTEPVIVTGG